MAASAEYDASLRSRIKPLLTGVGPVEAALSVGRTLMWLDVHGNLPTLVVSLGSAGSAILAQTGVYQVTSVAYRDMDASPLGFERGRTPLLDLPARIELPLHIPGIPEASLSTGGDVVSGQGYANVAADMVDMETYAVLRACQVYNLPLIGLRGISDGVEALRDISDWTRCLPIIDRGLAGALDLLFMALANGQRLHRS